MRDQFPFLRSLTIPTNAGPGDPRIVINGVDGRIEVYDNTGTLFAAVDPDDGFIVYGTDPDATISMDVDSSIPRLILNTDDASEDLGGFVYALAGVGANRQTTVFVQSPSYDGGADTSIIRLHSGRLDDSGPPDIDMVIDDTGFGGSAQIYSIPRGMPQGGIVVQNGTVSYTGSTVTDLAGVVYLTAGRRYKATLHTEYETSSLSSWRFNLRIDSTVVDRFHTLNTNGEVGTITDICVFTAGTTGNQDFDLAVVLLAGGPTTLDLQATAAVGSEASRYLLIEEIGGDV